MFIYLIRCNSRENPIKVGVSKAPEDRLKDLQTANPYELELVSKLYFKNERKAYAVEKATHKIFKENHMRGEWFCGVSPGNIISYLERKGGKVYGLLSNDECLDLAYLQSIRGVHI